MHALVVRPQWLEKILAGRKTWEIRGSRTAIRGRIGLIPSGSGTVTGVCDLVDSIGPLSAKTFRTNARRAGMHPSEATLGWYDNTYAWVVKSPKRLKNPVPYEHPSGAVIWVILDSKIERAILKQL